MKRLEDERIRFYLKHQQQIEEWVKVRGKVVPDFAHEFYRSLEEDIRNEVRERKIDVEISVQQIRARKAAIRLRRHDWPAAAEGPAVELGWHVHRAFSLVYVVYVWCGIWTRNTYFEKLSRARERPEAEDYPERDASLGYPMYRYIDTRADNFWMYLEADELEAYGNSVIRALLRAWRDLAPLVDEAVSQSGRQ